MFELLTETPYLLREGHLLNFQGDWPGDKGATWWQVIRAQAVKYDVGRIVPSGSTVDLDFRPPAAGSVGDLNLSLIPEDANTVYELLLGLQGHLLVYPMYNNAFALKLQTTGVYPDPTAATDSTGRLRYVGSYDQEDSPKDRPRLREHTINGQQPPVLRLYNDLFLDEKEVLRWTVNICAVVRIGTPSPDLQRLGRVARYHAVKTAA